MAGEFPIVHPLIATPGPPQGVLPIVVEDVIEPRYPAAASLVLYREGELEPAVPPIQVPHGAIICYVEPVAAVHVRAALHEAVRRATAQAKKLAEQRKRNGVGR